MSFQNWRGGSGHPSDPTQAALQLKGSSRWSSSSIFLLHFFNNSTISLCNKAKTSNKIIRLLVRLKQRFLLLDHQSHLPPFLDSELLGTLKFSELLNHLCVDSFLYDTWRAPRIILRNSPVVMSLAKTLQSSKPRYHANDCCLLFYTSWKRFVPHQMIQMFASPYCYLNVVFDMKTWILSSVPCDCTTTVFPTSV